MNMPRPMTANNYDKIASKLSGVTKGIAEEVMLEASEELHELAKVTSKNNTRKVKAKRRYKC